MYVDLWVIAIFGVLFAFCAWWNRRSGFLDGGWMVINRLLDEGVVTESQLRDFFRRESSLKEDLKN